MMPLFRVVLFLCGVIVIASFSAQAKVRLGIDVLEARHFDQLQGKRVGLITNATGVDSNGVSTVDILRNAPGVKLIALFGPEHGVYGADWAGAPVAGSIDSHTGLPVYSLYGKTKKPTLEMLKNIDVLVYDIQDIGCRSYTFISTLGLAMEAAGEAGIQFYVLDRPNPLNGNHVEGPMLDPQFRSFVGQWDIPYVYGLTPGEMAYMIQGQRWIKALPKLTIVPMTGWTRDMYWEDTGLMWIPTSPHIPTPQSAIDYSVTGMLGEAGGVCHGVGYTLPFSVVGHPTFDAFALTEQFNKFPIKGVYFKPITFQPFYAGFKGKIVKGVEIFYHNRDTVNFTNLGLYILHAVYHKPNIFMFQPDPSGEEGPAMFDKIAGTDTLRKAIIAGKTPEEIIASWQPGLRAYLQMRAHYLLPNYGGATGTVATPKSTGQAPPGLTAIPPSTNSTTPPPVKKKKKHSTATSTSTSTNATSAPKPATGAN